jgi:hypothetical protein
MTYSSLFLLFCKGLNNAVGTGRGVGGFRKAKWSSLEKEIFSYTPMDRTLLFYTLQCRHIQNLNSGGFKRLRLGWFRIY